MLLKFKSFLRKWVINPIIHHIYRMVSKSPSQLSHIYPSEIITTIFSDSSAEIFFGYHDKTPFSNKNNLVLAMRTPVSGNDPLAECSPIDIGFFNLDETNRENYFTKLETTTTWCWQQGCMLQWDSRKPDYRLFYNALVNGEYGAQLFDIKEKKVIQSFPNPIYSISKDAKLAVSLNFSRLGRLRPGYGYSLLPDSTLYDPHPKDDGLYIMNLQSGKTELLINLAELSAQVSCDPKDEHYINHASFSPDGLRIVFFHIWKLCNRNKRKIMFCSYDLKTSKLSEIERMRTTSHYCWRDENTILSTNVDQSGIWRYTFYDLTHSSKKDLEIDFKQDGHPMFSPVDKDIFITDTYPDKRGDQHLCIVDLKNNKTYELAALYSPLRYRGQVRCDLHPRWDRQGKYVCVDSTSSGKREMIIFEV